MPDSLGYILKRLREKKHYTQAEVIERSGLERSSSYISSLETNKTSPTIEELESLAVVYGTTVFDILSEAKGISPTWDFTPNPDIRLLLNFYESLNSERRKIALEFIQFLAEKQKMEKYFAGDRAAVQKTETPQ
ncbi:MAG: helix-turn-helix domain-containing protein [Chloroflexi bacterium]|nr:helix-turn-helix domain-containing protein [Chloroflexota bacterium]